MNKYEKFSSRKCPKCGSLLVETFAMNPEVFGTKNNPRNIICRSKKCKGWLCDYCGGEGTFLKFQLEKLTQPIWKQEFVSLDEWLNSSKQYDNNNKEEQNLQNALKHKGKSMDVVFHEFHGNVICFLLHKERIYHLSSDELQIVLKLSTLQIVQDVCLYISSCKFSSLQNALNDISSNIQVVVLDSYKAKSTPVKYTKVASFKAFAKSILKEIEMIGWHPYGTTCSVAMVKNSRTDEEFCTSYEEWIEKEEAWERNYNPSKRNNTKKFLLSTSEISVSKTAKKQRGNFKLSPSSKEIIDLVMDEDKRRKKQPALQSRSNP